MKVTLNKALNISSVKRVQYRINWLDPPKPRNVKKKLAQRPTQEYTGKNGSPFKVQNRNKPDMNASVSPVGAMNAIGWPQMTEYTIPLQPALKRNSTTPMESLVICDAIVPKLISNQTKQNKTTLVREVYHSINQKSVIIMTICIFIFI